MIIVVSPSDNDMLTTSRDQSANFPGIYGETYAWGDSIPPLQPTENLFITGHCTSENDIPLIGDSNADDPYEMTGAELALNIKDIFPEMYEGSVYVSACSSSDAGGYGFSLIEQFKNNLDQSVGNCDVFGQSGDVDYEIPPPSDPAWQPSIIDA